MVVGVLMVVDHRGLTGHTERPTNSQYLRVVMLTLLLLPQLLLLHNAPMAFCASLFFFAALTG